MFSRVEKPVHIFLGRGDREQFPSTICSAPEAIHRDRVDRAATTREADDIGTCLELAKASLYLVVPGREYPSQRDIQHSSVAACLISAESTGDGRDAYLWPD